MPCHPCNFRQLQWPMPSSSSIYYHPIPAQLRKVALQAKSQGKAAQSQANHVQGRQHHDPVARLPAPRRAAVAVPLPNLRRAGRLLALRQE